MGAGGKADPNEEPEITAVRELAEETGYTAGKVKHLVSFYPTCGYSNEHLHIYICRDLVKGETHWDKDECIEIMEFSADELITREVTLDTVVEDGFEYLIKHGPEQIKVLIHISD